MQPWWTDVKKTKQKTFEHMQEKKDDVCLINCLFEHNLIQAGTL